MNKRRSSVLKKSFKADSKDLADESDISSSGDENGFQNYYVLRCKERNMDDCSENETKIRSLWNNMSNSRRKLFIKGVEQTKLDRKRSSSMSDVNIADQLSTSGAKKMKTETIENSSTNDLDTTDAFFQLEVQRLIASPANYFFQPVCHCCEIFSENLPMIRCTGVCLRYFHRQCLKYLPDNPIPEEANFQCPDCWNNVYSCIICKKVDKITTLLYCENTDCGRLYHKICLEKSNFVSVNVTNDSIKSCPAHHCVTCVREYPVSIGKASKKLFQCIRCPASFHDDDLCMAAGSVELSLSQVICPRHFEDNLVKLSAYKPVHLDWCFTCYKSGAKILCQYCPNAFHPECISDFKSNSEKKENMFVCVNCCNHKQPRYGEIMFVKVGQYRWWPCEVIHPRNAPMNILRLKRPEGTFPIMFLGSNEYQWVSKSRVIPYNFASLLPIIKDVSGSLKMVKEFTAGLEQAAKMHRLYVNILRNFVPLNSTTAEPMSQSEILPYLNFHDSDKKTVRYSLIKSNVIIQPTKLPLKKVQVVCDCSDICELFKCKNYLSKVECDKETCPTNDKCQNRLFTYHVNKNLGVNKTSNRGFGLKTTEILKENEFIIEYVGEIINRSVSVDRINVAKKNNIKDFYMMKLSGDLIIDAGPKGNLSRFINHSCDPNCRIERWTVNGYVRVGIFANKDLGPDEELTFDYKRSGSILKEDVFCLCSSINCSGFLGPEKATNTSPSKIVKQEETMFNVRDVSVTARKESHDGGPTPKKAYKSTIINCNVIKITNRSVPEYEEGGLTEVTEGEEQRGVAKEETEQSKDGGGGMQERILPSESGINKSWSLLRPLLKTNPMKKSVGSNKRGRPPKESIGDMALEDFIKYCAPSTTNKGSAEGKFSEDNKFPKSYSKKKSNKLSKEKMKKKIDQIKINEEAAEKVRIIKRLTKELEMKEQTRKRGVESAEHRNLASEDGEEGRRRTREEACNDNGGVSISSVSHCSDKLEVINRCLKTKDPPEEFAKEAYLFVESTDRSRLTKESSLPPYDDITERLRATDAAIESLTKTVVIKDSSNMLLCRRQRKNEELKAFEDAKTSQCSESEEEGEYESFCFRCFDGGQLLLCDKKGCTKSYHLSCLGLKKAPVGTWYCPWHFCNSCGQPSDLFCVQCPGSYCQSHCNEGDIWSSPGTRLSLCRYHSVSRQTLFAMITEKRGLIKTAN